MKQLSFLSLILFTALLSSCSVMLYAPNSHNVPLLKEKDEVQVNANYIVQADVFSSVTGGELQVAYAATHHLGIMTNLFFSGGSNDDGEALHGHLFEVAAGGFQPFGHHGVFEAYGGAGFGGLNHSGNGGGSVGGGRLFIQPVIGYKSKAFDLAFSLRNGALIYGKPKGGAADEREYIDAIENNRISLLVEPAITLRLGWEYLKLQIQLGSSYNISNPKFQQSPGYLSFGIAINPAPRYNKSNKSASQTL